MILWMVGLLGMLLNFMLAISSRFFPRLLRRPCDMQRPFPNNSLAASYGPLVCVATFVSGHCCL